MDQRYSLTSRTRGLGNYKRHVLREPPGVATGGFSTKQLRESGADVVFEDSGIGTRFSGWLARSVGAREVPHAVIPLKL